MKTAVIGANGFIGSRVVESFHLGDGPAVIPIARDLSRVRLAARFAVDLRAADAGDEDALADAMAGCAGAVHAVRSEPADRKRHATAFCRAAARAGVRRAVYLGNASVHGPNPPAGTEERSRLPVDLLDADASACVAAERQFFAECRKSGIAGYALRPSIVHGPRSPLFAEIVTELADQRAWLIGDGGGICNLVYIDNLVAAIRLCLKTKSPPGQAFLIADEEPVTWRAWYHAIARELDLPTRTIRSVAEPPAPECAARATLQHATVGLSSGLAVSELGYTPVVDFAEGLRRCCVWWQFAAGKFVAA